MKYIYLIIISAIGFQSNAQNSISEILSNGKMSSKHNVHIDIVDNRGYHSSIPITIFKGKEAGQTISIVSGVHGFEYSSIIASYELIDHLDPGKLKGNVIIIPLANPNSFYGRTTFCNPQDNLNLNRVFPGHKHGSITEKIAHFITEKVISVSDVFIDMHGGDANEDLLPFIGYYNNTSQPELTQKIKNLAELSGFNYIVSWPYNLTRTQPAKYAFKQAVQDGKIALIVEAGKLGIVEDEPVELIRNAVLNMMDDMDIYKHEKTNIPDYINLNKQSYVRSDKRGIFYSKYSAGDNVEKGEMIGTIRNEFGEIIVELESPATGIILYKTSTPPINIGETIMCIAYKG